MKRGTVALLLGMLAAGIPAKALAGGRHGHFHGHHHGPSISFGFGYYPYVIPYTYPYPYVYYPRPYPVPPAAPYPVDDPDRPPPPPPGNPQDESTEEEEPASYGLIQLRGVPDGAEVDLDGRFWLRAQDIEQRWLALPEGKHTLRVRVPGGKTLERKIDVSGGRLQIVRFEGASSPRT
jgi:hypothetical protein